MLRTIAHRLPYLGPRLRQNARLREQLTHPPGHYYSPIPDLADLEQRSAEIWPAEVPRSVAGIDLNEAGQLATIERLARFYAEQPFPEHETAGCRYYFDNPFYRHSDALFLYAMLRDLQPKRLIEVGSGFSSVVTLETNERFLGNRTRCTFIDPDPARLRALLKPTDNIEFITRPVQSVDRSIFGQLECGDVLFIDSSHVSKIGSDVNMLFFDVLPRLAVGVHVHVHDILYPFEYSRDYACHAWNEAYLLRAFLTHNSAWRITIFPSFLERFHCETLQARMPLACPNSEGRGASIWIERIN